MPTFTIVNPSASDLMLRLPERFEGRYVTVPRASTLDVVLNDSEVPIVQLELATPPASTLGITFTVNDTINNPVKAVRAASTANVALTGLQTIDGVVLAAGDRVLLKNQTAGAANGIYTVSAGAWTRTSDANVAAEFGPGTLVAVSEGTTLGNSVWLNTTDAPVVLGTTALTFAKVSA